MKGDVRNTELPFDACSVVTDLQLVGKALETIRGIGNEGHVDNIPADFACRTISLLVLDSMRYLNEAGKELARHFEDVGFKPFKTEED